MKKIVLFDLDGTTIDTLEDLRSAVNKALRAEGYPERTHEEMLAFVGRGVNAMVKDAMPQDAPEESFGRALAIFSAEYDTHMDVLTKAYPGVCELIEKLHARGIKACVVSNKYDSAVRKLVTKLLPGMDGCIGTFDDMPKKPFPDTSLKLLSQMGFTADEGVYVGDSGVDVKTAENLGMPFTGVSWGFCTEEQLRAAGAEHICADADSLYERLMTFFA